MPQLIIQRQDTVTVPQPSMRVFINKEEVLSYLPHGKERAVTLPEGKHILQLKCDGRRSRPYVLDMNNTADKLLKVAVHPLSGRIKWLNWLMLPLWIVVLLTDKWWLMSIGALLIIPGLFWAIRSRQDSFEITEQTA